MNDITVHRDKRMTTSEVCEALGCDRVTLMRNWREIETCAAPEQVKKIENGKPTYWTEAEVTLLLEKMKGNANNQHNLLSQMEGIETSQSRVLRLQMLQKQMQDIYEAEIAELKTKAEVLTAANETLEIALNESLKYFTVAKYNRQYKKGWGLLEAQRIGKQIAGYCRSRSIEIRPCETNDERFGAVNSYPLTAWEDFLQREYEGAA